MSGDAKKLHLIEEILKIDSDTVLEKVETVIEKSKRESLKNENFTAFSGIWTKEEAEEMKRIIEESFEQINPDDWK